MRMLNRIEIRAKVQPGLRLACEHLGKHPDDARGGLLVTVPILGPPKVDTAPRETLILLAREFAGWVVRDLRAVPEDQTPILVSFQDGRRYVLSAERATRRPDGTFALHDAAN